MSVLRCRKLPLQQLPAGRLARLGISIGWAIATSYRGIRKCTAQHEQQEARHLWSAGIPRLYSVHHGTVLSGFLKKCKSISGGRSAPTASLAVSLARFSSSPGPLYALRRRQAGPLAHRPRMAATAFSFASEYIAGTGDAARPARPLQPTWADVSTIFSSTLRRWYAPRPPTVLAKHEGRFRRDCRQVQPLGSVRRISLRPGRAIRPVFGCAGRF